MPGVDVGTLIQRQRSASMTALQDYTRLKRQAGSSGEASDLAWGLVLDSLVFAAEAEIRWLDHCEARLRRAAAEAPVAGPSPATSGRRDHTTATTDEGASR